MLIIIDTEDAAADEVATNHDVGEMQAEPHLHRLVVTGIGAGKPTAAVGRTAHRVGKRLETPRAWRRRPC
jgi:hypothetical protein